MAGAAGLERIFRERLRGKERQGLPDGGCLGAVNADAVLVQAGKRALADPADHHGVDLLPLKGLQGVAGAVLVMQVAVPDDRMRVRRCIDDKEQGRGPEMAEYPAFESFIVLDRKTDLQ